MKPTKAMRPPIPAPHTTPDWHTDASCAKTGPDDYLWFPDKSGQYATTARDLCRACPVQAECLATALANDERFGMWGGLTPDEREQIKRREAI